MSKTVIRISLSLTGAVLAFQPGAAMAQEFDGPYVGVQGGLGILESEGSTIAGPFESSDQAAYIGGVAGYRGTVGGETGLVLGIEGDLGIYTDPTDARYGVSGIAGVTIGESSMLYTRAGYGWLDGVATPDGDGIDGLVLGAGFETQVSGGTHFRIDYKYLGYGDHQVTDATTDFTGHEITAGVIFGF